MSSKGKLPTELFVFAPSTVRYEISKSIWLEGARANIAAQDFTANPYIGRNSQAADLWREGWSWAEDNIEP